MFKLRYSYGKVGNDVFGRLIRSTMERNGICTDGLLRSETEPTTLAFVSLDERGDRSFSFYRQHSADCMLRSAELPLTLLEQAGIFHFGSVSMTAEPVRSATLEAVRQARSKGAAIAFDPNLRLPLWPDTDSAYHAICEGLRYAQAKGLDGRKLLGALATGAAGSKQMDALGGKILAGDHAPGFFLKHIVKDMTRARGESRDSGLSLEVLGQVLENCRDLEERGLGDLGTQALMVHYRPEE